MCPQKFNFFKICLHNSQTNLSKHLDLKVKSVTMINIKTLKILILSMQNLQSLLLPKSNLTTQKQAPCLRTRGLRFTYISL